MVASAAVFWRIAFRNVWRQRTKSLIVGFILFLCTGLIVFGNALVDAVDAGMEKSVTQSVSGHLQVYSAEARDALSVFGDEYGSMPDIGVIPDFAALAAAVRKVENVRAIVPMGINFAMGQSGNELDRWLATLRQAVREGDPARIAERRDEVRAVCERLLQELQNTRDVAAADSAIAQDIEQARRAASPEFWAGFDADPLGSLEFLENKVAPLEAAMSELWLQFLGTDLDAFAQNFDRFEIVEGTAVPKGQRGFLMNHGFYEEAVKHRVARELDKMKKLRAEGASFESDADLRSRRDQLPTQYRRVLYQLDRKASADLTQRLRALLGTPDTALPDLLQSFLKVDDANFDARYAFFYEHVAPQLQLYAAKVGDVIPLQGYTKSGYSKSINVKVYGTFRFKGLEDSDIGKMFNLVDLVTFRDLYGMMTPERRAEVQALREQAGVKDVKREDAEAALFGEAAPAIERQVETAEIDELAGLAKVARGEANQAFDPAELERGVALNAAVVLADPTRLHETKAAIEAALKDAGLKMQVIDWQAASGMVGMLVVVARGVLWVIIFVLLIVAAVVINNSMVIATMERVKEIGTMRAIGAGRGWIRRLFLAETAMLGLVSGGLGAACAAGAVVLWGRVGLPAPNAFMQFLFGGPRLHPWFESAHLVSALVIILLFALISTLYPAALASRVSPRAAMASDG